MLLLKEPLQAEYTKVELKPAYIIRLQNSKLESNKLNNDYTNTSSKSLSNKLAVPTSKALKKEMYRKSSKAIGKILTKENA